MYRYPEVRAFEWRLLKETDAPLYVAAERKGKYHSDHFLISGSTACTKGQHRTSHVTEHSQVALHPPFSMSISLSFSLSLNLGLLFRDYCTFVATPSSFQTSILVSVLQVLNARLPASFSPAPCLPPSVLVTTRFFFSPSISPSKTVNLPASIPFCLIIPLQHFHRIGHDQSSLSPPSYEHKATPVLCYSSLLPAYRSDGSSELPRGVEDSQLLQVPSEVVLC